MGLFLILAGVACAAYGACIMLAWSGSSFFAVWYALGASLAGAGLLMRAGIWDKLAGPVRAGAAAVALVALVGVLVLSALIMRAASDEPPAGLDYLIVLGAQVRPDGAPSVSLDYRLQAARDYLLENPGTRCIVSGGRGSNEPSSEADAMAAWLEAAGIAPERIAREGRSTNTVENIRFSLALVDAPETARVGIVTNDFHLYRALGIARAQGIAHAYAVPAGSVAFYLPSNVLRECLGVCKDVLSGNMAV